MKIRPSLYQKSLYLERYWIGILVSPWTPSQGPATTLHFTWPFCCVPFNDTLFHWLMLHHIHYDGTTPCPYYLGYVWWCLCGGLECIADIFTMREGYVGLSVWNMELLTLHRFFMRYATNRSQQCSTTHCVFAIPVHSCSLYSMQLLDQYVTY